MYGSGASSTGSSCGADCVASSHPPSAPVEHRTMAISPPVYMLNTTLPPGSQLTRCVVLVLVPSNAILTWRSFSPVCASTRNIQSGSASSALVSLAHTYRPSGEKLTGVNSQLLHCLLLSSTVLITVEQGIWAPVSGSSAKRVTTEASPRCASVAVAA